jgi:hypothetical protein
MHVCAAAAEPTVAPSLVSLHVAANAERFSTTAMRAAERLLASVAVGVDLQARRTAERLTASRAEVTVLLLWQGTCRRVADVVVVVLICWSGRLARDW